MNYIKHEETITSDRDWTAPTARDQKFEVILYGGGGSGSCDGNYFSSIGGAGGGSGEMKTGEFIINAGTRVDISIGSGGQGIHNGTTRCNDFIDYIVGKSGGTTTFGTYLCANGGLGGNIGSGGLGGHTGGDSGMNASGNYVGYGVNGSINGIEYHSGGGAPAVNARGVGGSANSAGGNGGTSGGGAGCYITDVSKEGVINRSIGSGGQGVCVIRYYTPIP